jgi:predicted DCC family thiol-disulfide oxidoreductase YuxK
MRRANPTLTIRQPPERPTLVYDGTCRFCRCQVERWKQRTGAAVDYLASNTAEIANRFPEIPSDDFDQSVQFIDTDGRVSRGAHGVLKLFTWDGRPDWRLALYERSRWFAAMMELGYRLVATQRGWLSRLSPCARRTKP